MSLRRSAPELAASSSSIGRPRSDEAELRILRAALDALVAEGFDGMTIEGVATRASAGKATLYRRWRNKPELVADALSRHVSADVQVVDTGDIRADMRAFLRRLVAAYRGLDGKLVAAFAAERIRHPELGEAFDRYFIADRRIELRALVRAAIQRGQLPSDSDADLLAQVGPAVVLHELVVRRARLNVEFADRIVAQFFGTD